MARRCRRLLVRAYHPTAKLQDGAAELAALYRSVLHDQRALLLMDSAAASAQVEPLLLPASCLLLVTLRVHFALPGLQPSLPAHPRSSQNHLAVG